MIKINLLPQKRSKLARSPDSRVAGKEVVIGVGALVVGAAVIVFGVDRPRRARLGELRAANARLDQEIAAKNRQLDGYADLKKSVEEAEKRSESIARLMAARFVPAHALHELGKIMQTGELPTMTEEMARRTGSGPDSDPNKRFDLAWDPSHVWITSFVDKANEGTFRIEGGAQAEIDIIQLSKRMQASVYFDKVSLLNEERATDRTTGVSFYTFVLTGKVAY